MKELYRRLHNLSVGTWVFGIILLIVFVPIGVGFLLSCAYSDDNDECVKDLKNG
jgi:hypothetical protein